MEANENHHEEMAAPSPLTSRAALLLALLEGSAGGLAVIHRVCERTGGAVRLYQGAVYPALHALVAEGLARELEAVAPGPGGSGRAVVPYVLTPAGRRAAEGVRGALRALVGEGK